MFPITEHIIRVQDLLIASNVQLLLEIFKHQSAI